jgi:hypothetical protein
MTSFDRSRGCPMCENDSEIACSHCDGSGHTLPPQGAAPSRECAKCGWALAATQVRCERCLTYVEPAVPPVPAEPRSAIKYTRHAESSLDGCDPLNCQNKEHWFYELEPRSAIQATYFVHHPDGSYTEADPQPIDMSAHGHTEPRRAEQLTAAANELLRELNERVFNDSIDITKLHIAVGLCEDFAEAHATILHEFSENAVELASSRKLEMDSLREKLAAAEREIEVRKTDQVKWANAYSKANFALAAAQKEIERLRGFVKFIGELAKPPNLEASWKDVADLARAALAQEKK